MAKIKRVSVRRRRVSAELRTLRVERGLTCLDVAKALDCSESKISRMHLRSPTWTAVARAVFSRKTNTSTVPGSRGEAFVPVALASDESMGRIARAIGNWTAHVEHR